MSQGREIEAKFYLRHLALVRRRLLALGGRLLVSRQLERNLRFDTPQGALTAAGQVLRLRQDSQIMLTYKRRLSGEERQEIEVEVDDLAASQALLEALGFRIFARYEKYRETFQLGPVKVMLDEMPYGCFVEVEGPTLQAVARAAADLGLEWERRIEASYMELFERLRRRLDLPFRDATFANFQGHPSASAEDLGVRDATPSQGNEEHHGR